MGNVYYPAQLPEIDTIEVLTLEHTSSSDASTDPFLYMFSVTSSTQVEGRVANQIADLWRTLLDHEQMLCHNPPFGLRFWMGGKLLLEASICWECFNIRVQSNGQLSYARFASYTPNAKALYALLQEVTSNVS